MYENYPKLCISFLLLALLAYGLSPRDTLKVNVPIVSAHNIEAPKNEAKQTLLESFLSWTIDNWHTRTNTWWTRMELTSTGKLQWVHETSCKADCKVKTLVKIWMNERIAWSLVYTCKDKANDPRHCIIVASAILKSESNLWKKCNGYNCFGMWGWSFKYKTYEEWVEDFVRRYNKYWYKAKSASFFYPLKWWKSPSRYCTSEASSNSSVGCPNGRRHAQYMWDILSKKF